MRHHLLASVLHAVRYILCLYMWLLRVLALVYQQMVFLAQNMWLYLISDRSPTPLQPLTNRVLYTH